METKKHVSFKPFNLVSYSTRHLLNKDLALHYRQVHLAGPLCEPLSYIDDFVLRFCLSGF